MSEADNRALCFDSAAAWLGRELLPLLSGISEEVKASAQEIRLRAGCPVCVVTPTKTFFIGNDKREREGYDRDCLTVSLEMVGRAFNSLCEFSVHTHQQEMERGYITVRGGHRAGLCGTAVMQDGRLSGIRNITGINLRIARQMTGCAGELISSCYCPDGGGILVAGAPSSGKTTVLRDVARILSSPPYCIKTAVVDERGEIGGVYRGIRGANLGLCCDLLDGYPKAQGIQIAVRVLSPEMVIFDEAGTARECAAVGEGVNCGAVFIAAVHAGSYEELKRRTQVQMLLKTGAFSKVVLLEGRQAPGKIKGIYAMEEICLK